MANNPTRRAVVNTGGKAPAKKSPPRKTVKTNAKTDTKAAAKAAEAAAKAAAEAKHEQAKKDHADALVKAQQAVDDAAAKVEEVTTALNSESDDEKKATMLQDLSGANTALTDAKNELQALQDNPPKADAASDDDVPEEEEATILVNVPKTFFLTMQNKGKKEFRAGVRKMTQEELDHWWVKANGVTKVE
jgi:hypothetical protein